MNRAEQLALIDKAFDALPDMDRGWVCEKDRLYQLCFVSEQKHRAGGRPCGISKAVAAKLFTVKLIAEGMDKPGRYVVGDVLKLRIECLHAQALAELFPSEISCAWGAAGVRREDVLQLDYVELMK